MLVTYNMTDFGVKIKNIRKSLNYTLDEIHELTGIKNETLSRIENGKSIPKFETLELLSSFYKTNLLELLNNSRTPESIQTLYDSIENLILMYDTEEIKKAAYLLDKEMASSKNQFVNKKEIGLMKSFLSVISKLYKSDAQTKQQLIKELEASLKNNISAFSIAAFDSFKYSFIEVRILFTIAAIYGDLGSSKLSNEILLFILKTLDFSKGANLNEKKLITKVYGTISSNYKSLSDDDESLEYAEKGINFCISNQIMFNLPLLYVRKFTALYSLKDANAYIYLDHAINLLKAQNKYELAQEYIDIISKEYLIVETNKLQEI